MSFGNVLREGRELKDKLTCKCRRYHRTHGLSTCLDILPQIMQQMRGERKLSSSWKVYILFL
jgi:hypothetical protein